MVLFNAGCYYSCFEAGTVQLLHHFTISNDYIQRLISHLSIKVQSLQYEKDKENLNLSCSM